MDSDALITQLQELARTKAAPPPLSPSDLAKVEAALGISLNGLLRRIYLEVSNGGLFGLFGIRTSTAAVEEDSSLTDGSTTAPPDPEATRVARIARMLALR